jgi:hypothetical protein
MVILKYVFNFFWGEALMLFLVTLDYPLYSSILWKSKHFNKQYIAMKYILFTRNLNLSFICLEEYCFTGKLLSYFISLQNFPVHLLCHLISLQMKENPNE